MCKRGLGGKLDTLFGGASNNLKFSSTSSHRRSEGKLSLQVLESQSQRPTAHSLWTHVPNLSPIFLREFHPAWWELGCVLELLLWPVDALAADFFPLFYLQNCTSEMSADKTFPKDHYFFKSSGDVRDANNTTDFSRF